ncbi:MAG: hypothetical protein KGL96_12745, partial [Hyphomicrobiales bacterium]|nr:hypothetical protein [Hyphomicrobiales bacterium]
MALAATTVRIEVPVSGCTAECEFIFFKTCLERVDEPSGTHARPSETESRASLKPSSRRHHARHFRPGAWSEPQLPIAGCGSDYFATANVDGLW